MNPRYETFTFLDYSFDPSTKRLTCSYQFDITTTCTETYVFDFPFVTYDPAALDHAMQLLFFLAGVSYYKMYLPPKIQVSSGVVDAELSEFLSETYQKGLGEFFYTNQLDPKMQIAFPTTGPLLAKTPVVSSGSLIAIGGGKDSLVSVELLRDSGLDIATWSVGHRTQLMPLINRIGLPHYFVERILDPNIAQFHAAGAYNGHVPISAVFAAVGAVVAVLTGRRDIILSNEQSSNEPTLKYHGVDINHQYSKSEQFEQQFQSILQTRYGGSIRYYSLLRPYTELRIAELFAQTGFQKYKDVFSSCNKAFRQGETHLFWCGECPKCAFVFLALTPFVDKSELEALFNGENLLTDVSLEPLYRQLLGIEADKPLECVGTVAESRAAMKYAQQLYPHLQHYIFDLAPKYDFRKVYPGLVPTDVLPYVTNTLSER